MSTRLEIVQDFGNAGDIVAFLQRHVNPRMTSEAFEWQFVRIPDRPVLTVTRDANGICCTQSFLPHDLHHAGGMLPTVKSEHSFLLPTYRGTPVFTDAYAAGLAASADAGRRICWGFTPAVKVWRDRLGFEVFDEIMYECVARIARPRFAFSPFPKGPMRSIYGLLRRTAVSLRTLFHRPARSTDLRAQDRPAQVSEIDALFAAIAPVETVRLDMNAAFLEWRFTANPNTRFHVRTFRSPNGLAGYYILAHDGSGDVLHLSDMVFRTVPDGHAMLDHLLNEFGRSPGRLLQYFGNRRNAINQRVFDLLQRRFACDLSLNKEMAFVVKRDDRATGGVENWYMNGAWTQGFTR